MKKLNILVTTVGGLTSPDILNALKYNGEREINLIGVDSFDGATGQKFVDIFKVITNSNNEEQFIDEIRYLSKKYQIDIIIPCGNEDNIVLSKYKKLIPTTILVGEYKNILNSFDKGFVYQEMEKYLPENAPKYKIINTFEDFLSGLSYLNFPKNKVVIKPRNGRGGRGVYVIIPELNFEEVFSSKPSQEFPLDFFRKILSEKQNFEDLILMEYLKEPFYSIYSLHTEGKNVISLSHIRQWGTPSQTYRGSVFYDKDLENIAEKIITLFNLEYTSNMELGVSLDGRIVLFDLNPRIGASSGIDKSIGVNFPYLAVKLALGETINIDKTLLFQKEKIFIRYFDYYWK